MKRTPVMPPGRRAAVLLLCWLALLSACTRLPPEMPAEGVGRAAGSAEASSSDPAGSAAQRPSGIPLPDGPAFEALPLFTDGEKAEIDLTELDAGSLYAAVGTMNGAPEEYAGRTVLMAGYFETEETRFGRRFYCSVPDYAGCCFVSVEIRPGKDLRWPEDWPEEGGVFTVTGVFGFDRVSEYLSYSYLDDTRIAWTR